MLHPTVYAIKEQFLGIFVNLESIQIRLPKLCNMITKDMEAIIFFHFLIMHVLFIKYVLDIIKIM